MRLRPWHIALLLACGAAACNPPGSPTPSGSPTQPGPSAEGWKVDKSGAEDVPKLATFYQSIDNVKTGDEVRATLIEASAPVDVRLYVYPLDGQDKTIEEKKGVTTAELKGKAPVDGTLQLSIKAGQAEKTTVKYTLQQK
ncbi:MAG TPA: hypothetical protein VMS17_00060 [Gemmataceae bacterium]|nr:hypothetical protein [Gemmataceae bacterium]